MDYSVSEISNSLDKGSVYEGMSMFRASLEDETSRLAEGVKPEAISNEKIQKDDNILGTYLVVSNAIHGGMGSVWRVHHKSWNVDLAMKRPQPKFFAEGSEKRKENFVQECESWIDLGLHPNIVSCYYVRSIGGAPSIFSEWMNGGSLKDRMKDGSLYKGDTGEQQERLLDIAIQTARGLRYSHSKNLLHMDVKPGNILLTSEGDVKLSDFGLARARGNLTRGTAQAVSGYTAEYCPDAQKSSGDPSPWMDGFAWAVTILELYAGERRWKTGQEAFKRLDEITRDTRVPVPRDLYDLFKRCFSFSKKSLFRKKDDSHLFDEIEDTLLRIYASATGKEYQRPEPDVLSDTAGTRNNTALSYYDLGRADTACELIDKAYESDPEDPSVVYNRNLLLFRQKKIRCQDAVRTLAAAVLKTGNNRDAFYYLRMCMEPGICFAVDEFKEMAGKAGSVLIRSEEERALLEHAEKVCSEAAAEEDQIYDLLGRDFFVERNTGYEGDVDKEICYNEASGRFYICFTGKSVVTGLFDRAAGKLSDIEEFPIPDVLSCLAVSPDGKHLLITVKGNKVRNNDQSKEPVLFDASSKRRTALTGLPEGLCLSPTVCFDGSGQSFYVVLYKKHGPKGVIKNGVYYAEIGPEADKIAYIAEFDLAGRYISTVTSREPNNVKYNPKGISISGMKSIGSRLFLFRNEKIPSETQFFNSAYLGIYDKKDGSYSENKKSYNGILAVSDDGSLAAAAGTGELAILDTGSLEEVCRLDFSKDSPPSVVGDLLVNRLYRFRLRRGNGLYGAGSHRTFIPKQSLTPGAGLFIKQIRSYEEMSASEEEFRTLMQQAERRMPEDPGKALELIGRARTVEGYENNIQALDLQQKCMAALKKDHPLAIRSLMLRAEMEEQKGKDSFSWRNAAFDRKGGRIAYYTGSALVVRSLPGLQEIFRVAGARPRFYDRKSIAFSPDGNTLFAGDVSKKAALYDRTGKVIWAEEYTNMVTNASFSSDGKYIMATFSAASEDPLSAALISAKDGKILSRISDHRARFEALFINRDSEFVWVAQNGPSSGDFEFRSVPGLELIETMKAWTNISKPMSFNDGEDIFGLGAGHYGYINLLRRSEKKLIKYTETLPYTGAYDMADGGKLLAYYDHSGEVVIEETDGDRITRELFRLEAKEGAADLYFTDDCRYLLVLIGGAALRCYELDWGL